MDLLWENCGDYFHLQLCSARKYLCHQDREELTEISVCLLSSSSMSVLYMMQEKVDLLC